MAIRQSTGSLVQKGHFSLRPRKEDSHWEAHIKSRHRLGGPSSPALRAGVKKRTTCRKKKTSKQNPLGANAPPKQGVSVLAWWVCFGCVETEGLRLAPFSLVVVFVLNPSDSPSLSWSGVGVFAPKF